MKIHVLTPDISNKIAAGEVVERPASIVKELIENSVDAGATSITVEIQNGGITYIRVTDNGCGMSEDDAVLAFERHATSKIRSADDLFAISTMGFRGEALASVAAVAKVELMTKTADADGVLIKMEGGVVTGRMPAGCPVGTTIVVRDLFFNTPARMKFLKSDRSEAGYITDIVERLVMANPNISVKYIADGKEKLFFGGDGNLRSAIYSVYGKEYAEFSLPLEREGKGITVSGYVGKAELSRGNRSFQSLFVNGRYVKNRAISAVVENAYKNTLMTGKFPFFVIHLNIPPDRIDINVHPTKQDVKFSEERTVCDEVYWAVKGALSMGADELRNKMKAEALPEENTVQEVPVQEKPVFRVSPSFKPVSFERPVGNSMQEPLKAKETCQKAEISLESFFTAIKGEEKVEEKIIEEVEVKEEQPTVKPYKIIGQVFNTYIIIECGEELIVIDQHAAHERMIYEDLLKKRTVNFQMLLTPVSVPLSPEEYARIFEYEEDMKKLGFDFDDFGRNTILVRQIPARVGAEDTKALICEILSKIHLKSDNMTERESNLFETIACKAAVKGNNRLSDSEIRVLIEDVLGTNGINSCPHGRPLMVNITKKQLEKMFKRVI